MPLLLYISLGAQTLFLHMVSLLYEIRSLPASQRLALVKPLLSTAVYHLGLDKVTLLGLLSAFFTKPRPRKKTAFHLYHQHVQTSAGRRIK